MTLPARRHPNIAEAMRIVAETVPEGLPDSAARAVAEALDLEPHARDEQARAEQEDERRRVQAQAQARQDAAAEAERCANDALADAVEGVARARRRAGRQVCTP